MQKKNIFVFSPGGRDASEEFGKKIASHPCKVSEKNNNGCNLVCSSKAQVFSQLGIDMYFVPLMSKM